MTDHILQNYSLNPALGLENYSRFSAAIVNNIQLNLPCLPQFHKRQPWLDVELANLLLEYFRSRSQYLSARSPTNQDSMPFACLICTLPSKNNTFIPSVTTSTLSLVMGKLNLHGLP